MRRVSRLLQLARRSLRKTYMTSKGENKRQEEVKTATAGDQRLRRSARRITQPELAAVVVVVVVVMVVRGRNEEMMSGTTDGTVSRALKAPAPDLL